MHLVLVTIFRDESILILWDWKKSNKYLGQLSSTTKIWFASKGTFKRNCSERTISKIISFSNKVRIVDYYIDFLINFHIYNCTLCFIANKANDQTFPQ